MLAYDGWQQDMEEKGFEILSKAEKPAVEAPEKAEPEDKGSVSLCKVGCLCGLLNPQVIVNLL